MTQQQQPLWQLSATELARRYRDRTLTPLAVAHDVLARIDAVNGRLNAVVSRRDKAMLAEAQAAGERFARGAPLSMLDGIPITVKDSLYLDGLPTTCGTPALTSHQPGHDELAAARAREAGALILGKTNVPEFANDGYTANPVFGVTGNPWAPDLTPGGSSEGFSPTRPVCEAGRRMEPPPSCAMASGPMPDATAATAPPLEPPGVRSGAQGLPVTPNTGLAV